MPSLFQLQRYPRAFRICQAIQHSRWLSTSQKKRSQTEKESESSTSKDIFYNTEEAYRSKTTPELLRHYLVFFIFRYQWIVDRSHKLVNFSRKWLGERAFSYLMKKTVYGHFVPGEDLTSLRAVISRYRQSGIRPILEYTVEEDIPDENNVVLETRSKAEDASSKVTPYDSERFPQFKTSVTKADVTTRASARTYFYDSEKKCDDVMMNVISSANMAADVAEPGDAPFAAMKITGLGRVEFLLRLSEVMEGTHQLFADLADGMDEVTSHITPQSFFLGLAKKGVKLKESEADRLYRDIDRNNTKNVGIFEWLNCFQPGSELYQQFRSHKGLHPYLAVLEDGDLAQMQSVIERSYTIAECAKERKVRLMVDAEQTYFQPAIRHIAVYILMPKYNQERPVVYNTVQCYLKNADKVVRVDLEYSKKCGFHYGLKLVRGAYLEQEKEGAIKKGAVCPVWGSKSETDECYDRNVKHLLRHVRDGRISLMIAGHNVTSIGKAIDLMDKYQIDGKDKSVAFGQLLGMADHISFTLGSRGYNCYKYMPYGSVNDVIPYLIRRAFENRGILIGAAQERRLVAAEIRRRSKL